MADQKPTVGRIVHVTDPRRGGPVCLAALVVGTADEGGLADLVIFADGAMSGTTSRRLAQRADAWHWPERE